MTELSKEGVEAAVNAIRTGGTYEAMVCAAILAYLPFHSGGAGVRVKELEWGVDSGHAEVWRAASIIGSYQIWWGDKAYWMKAGRATPQRFTTLEEAKAAAQADYTARILSTLVPAPLAGDEKLREALRNVPDETIRHIAESKDVASCRERIVRALTADGSAE